MDITFSNPNIHDFFNNVKGSTPPLAEFKEAMSKPLLPGNFILEIKVLTETIVKQMSRQQIGEGITKRLIQLTNRLTARKIAYNALIVAEERSSSVEDKLLNNILEALRDLRFLLLKILRS